MAPLSSPAARPDPASPVVVLGDAYVDDVYDSRGQFLASFVGGSGVNVATDLVHLGLPCVLVTSFGDDEGGRRIREHLDDHGIPVRATIANGRTGLVKSTVSAGVTRSWFDERCRKRRIRFDDDQLAVIAAAPYVAVAGFPFDDRKQHRRLLEAVNQPQNRLLLDANPRAGLIDDLDEFRRNFERQASGALLVHLGTGDADLVFSSPIDEATSDLLDLGARNVLATEGRHGGRWVNRTGVDAWRPAVDPEGEIVDTLGAGDAAFAVAVESVATEGVPTTAPQASRLLDRAMAFAHATVRRQGGGVQDVEELPASVRPRR